MQILGAAFFLFFMTASVLSATDPCDFNGDGYEDLAIGVQESFQNSSDYGYVHILYGTDRGLSTTNTQIWHRAISGVPGDPAFGEFFGAALACGNFNGDDYVDLAIHIASGSGQVLILNGSSKGLTTTGNQLWTPKSAGLHNVLAFYNALASGDFDGDGFADLAVHAEPAVNFGASGAVVILYGTPSGLSSSGFQVWTQDTSGIADSAENGDGFGFVLKAANFGKDGSSRCYDDLAISVDENFPRPIPDEEEPFMEGVGAVHVIYGSSNGLTASGSQYFHQDSTGMPDTNEDGDRWGNALAAGAFRGIRSNCGGLLSDLAVGAPGENGNGGAVQVLYAKTTGLTTDGNQRWTQNTPGVTDATEPDDFFGVALAAGRTSSGRYYLAVGSPGESIGTTGYTGIVQVLFPDSTTGKLSAAGMKTFNQNTSGIADSVEPGDQFGLSLSAGNFNNFGTDELVIGVPNEMLNGQLSAGAMHVLHGAATTTTQFWHQNVTGVPDTIEALDRFGHLLSD